MSNGHSNPFYANPAALSGDDGMAPDRGDQAASRLPRHSSRHCINRQTEIVSHVEPAHQHFNGVPSAALAVYRQQEADRRANPHTYTVGLDRFLLVTM